LPFELLGHELLECLTDLKPFGHGFWEPSFSIEARLAEVKFYNDKVTGQPKHSAVFVNSDDGMRHKVMFFNQVLDGLVVSERYRFLVTVGKNVFRNKVYIDMYGIDWSNG
jgi:single-stranded DNA-specific DHH superfamily exonuclease